MQKKGGVLLEHSCYILLACYNENKAYSRQ
jgi:hypothetical protein